MNDEAGRRVVALAAAEVEYLNDAGWGKRYFPNKHEVFFSDPLHSHRPIFKQSEAVRIQKERDGFSEWFP